MDTEIMDKRLQECGIALKEYIDEEGLSKQRLALMMDIHTVTLNRILKGEMVKPYTLMRVRKFLRDRGCV